MHIWPEICFSFIYISNSVQISDDFQTEASAKTSGKELKKTNSESIPTHGKEIMEKNKITCWINYRFAWYIYKSLTNIWDTEQLTNGTSTAMAVKKNKHPQYLGYATNAFRS